MQGFWELQSKQADGGGPLLALDETLSFVFNFSPDAVRGHFEDPPTRLVSHAPHLPLCATGLFYHRRRLQVSMGAPVEELAQLIK
jgi:hypothetical protein